MTTRVDLWDPNNSIQKIKILGSETDGPQAKGGSGLLGTQRALIEVVLSCY